MTDSVTVHQAGLADLDTLAPIFDDYRCFYGQAGNLVVARDFLKARFDHGESVLFIAFDGDSPAGFTQLYPSFSSVSAARTFVLNDLFVREPFRRRGIASRLMAAAKEYATALGAVRISLTTEKTNVRAQALYRAAGWVADDKFFVYHHALPD